MYPLLLQEIFRGILLALGLSYPQFAKMFLGEGFSPGDFKVFMKRNFVQHFFGKIRKMIIQLL